MLLINDCFCRPDSPLGTTTREINKRSMCTVVFQIPEIGELVTPMYPDSVENALGNSEKDFALDNYRFKMIKPLRQWNISFEGKMK